MPLYACAKLFTRAQLSSYACETTGFHLDVFFVTSRYFFLTIVLRVARKVIWESFTVRICINVLQDLFSLLFSLSLILIYSADACILDFSTELTSKSKILVTMPI